MLIYSGVRPGELFAVKKEYVIPPKSLTILDSLENEQIPKTLMFWGFEK